MVLPGGTFTGWRKTASPGSSCPACVAYTATRAPAASFQSTLAVPNSPSAAKLSPKPNGSGVKELTGLVSACANSAEARNAAVCPLKYLEIPEPGPEEAVRRLTPSWSSIVMVAMVDPYLIERKSTTKQDKRML